jgi:hypothetical protein
MATITSFPCYAATRPRGFDVAYGHAMPCASPEWVLCAIHNHLLTHKFGISGISMPISRGSPPVPSE